MPRVSHHFVAGRPIQDVFAVISTARFWPQWHPATRAVAMVVFWLAKKRRRATWTEAVCPACIGLRLLAEHARPSKG